MFAELEAFAVEDGVPAVAAAHGIEAAVQVPAAIRVGVKEFVLAFIAITFAFGIFLSVGSLILEEIELRRFPRARCGIASCVRLTTTPSPA